MILSELSFNISKLQDAKQGIFHIHYLPKIIPQEEKNYKQI